MTKQIQQQRVQCHKLALQHMLAHKLTNYAARVTHPMTSGDNLLGYSLPARCLPQTSSGPLVNICKVRGQLPSVDKGKGAKDHRQIRACDLMLAYLL